MICTFCGHSDFRATEKQRSKLTAVIEDVIKLGATEFYCGGYGDFDNTCASIVTRLKEQYSHIKCIFIIPYITESYAYRNRENAKHYDEIIYPQLERDRKSVV